MLKRMSLMWIVLLYIVTIAGCDPIYPIKNLKIEYAPAPLPIGTFAEIKITHPNDGIAEIVWDNQQIEIVSGADVLEISGLYIKGLKAGTAILEITSTAKLVYEISGTPDERVYTKRLKVKVK
ncbi:MAG: hypothetical protein FWH04_08325 [Oscillospiraceae bacterium]|nr:hypothetical protein [Oscillospiraceae bacterium]